MFSLQFWSLTEKNSHDVELKNTGENQEAEKKLPHDFLTFGTLFLYPGDMNINIMKTLATTHPCGCTVETIYPAMRLLIIVWDTEDLRSVGLPPSNTKTVSWTKINGSQPG